MQLTPSRLGLGHTSAQLSGIMWIAQTGFQDLTVCCPFCAFIHWNDSFQSQNRLPVPGPSTMLASSSSAPSTQSSETLIGPASPFLVTEPQSLQPENPLDIILKCNSPTSSPYTRPPCPTPAVNYRLLDNPLLHGCLHPGTQLLSLNSLRPTCPYTAGSDTHQRNPSSNPFHQSLGWGLYRNMPWASVPQPLLPCGGKQGIRVGMATQDPANDLCRMKKNIISLRLYNTGRGQSKSAGCSAQRLHLVEEWMFFYD